MAEKEDNLGLMPSLQMGPSGYIPPMAAVLGSGLAGITAQQSALQKQLAQEADQRRKEQEQELQNIGKVQYTLGTETLNPELMAKGAGAMTLGGQQFTPQQFASQIRQKRFENIQKFISDTTIPLALRQQVFQDEYLAPMAAMAKTPGLAPAAMPQAQLQQVPAVPVQQVNPAIQGLAPATAPIIVPAAPAGGQPAVSPAAAGTAPAGVQPETAGTPAPTPVAAEQPEQPVYPQLVETASKDVITSRTTYNGLIQAAINQIEQNYRAMGLSPSATATARKALTALFGKVRAAKNQQDFDAIDAELARIQQGLTYTIPTGRPKAPEEFLAGGFKWKRRNVQKPDGTIETVIDSVSEVPLNRQQQEAIRLRRMALALQAGNLGIARENLARAGRAEVLALEDKVSKGIDDKSLRAQAAKDAVAIVQPRYAVALKSQVPSEAAAAQAAFTADVDAKTEELYSSRRAAAERTWSRSEAGRAVIRGWLSSLPAARGGATRGGTVRVGGNRVVNVLDSLTGVKVGGPKK